MKIFIVGGGGYVGAKLTELFLKKNFIVTIYDLLIYGEDKIPHNKNLKIVKGDVRDLNFLEKNIKGQDIVIHLACISNDPSFELDPNLGKSINYDCFEGLVDIAKKNYVKKFIYASSSSVYGIKKEKNVTEEMSLEPLTDYSKFKVECEKILLKNKTSDFVVSVIRPATVCGYSTRLRLDLIVNIFTNLAFHKNEITIFGGEQLRPNVHIDDMCDAYLHLVNCKNELINGEVFNVGIDNLSVNQIAELVKKNIPNKVELKKIETNDNRSYHVSSEKIKKHLGFSFNKTVEDAVKDLVNAFQNKKVINPLVNSDYFNIKKMQEIKLV